ncbi:MAG: DUF1800 domain-containing protein [Pseudomonadota bacterium]
MTTKQKSRRDFLYASGAAGLLAAGASTIPLTALASQLHTTSLWPARVPDQNQGRGGNLPPLGIRVYSKLGFGPRPGDLSSFNGLAANDDARLSAWLTDQFDRGPDPEVTSRLNSSRYQTLTKPLTQLWADHHRYEGDNSWQVRNRPYWEMQLAALTRNVHSRWQLQEMLADFWHNHFNVDGGEDVVRSVLPDYDQNVIRSDMFGNFRQMLEKVVKHAAMMYYLDNRLNGIPNPNENYARELLELHTLGAVENYFGFVNASEVPNNIDGEPAGYVEQDVIETARLLTGFGIADDNDFPAGSAQNNGQFVFRSERHDFDSKTIMGQNYPGTGEPELDSLLDYLCQHRGTAEFICWKLAIRLIGDSFSASSPLVQSAADIFQNNWQNANQLRLVYEHMLDSNMFKQTWADKARRPMEIISSALRAADVDYDFQLSSAGPDAGFYGYYWTWRDAGQMPFNCEPPTGYPEDRAIWKGSGPLIMSWRAISRMLRDIDSVDGGDNHFVNLAQQTNDAGIARTPNAITDYWLNRVLGPGHGISSSKRNEMVAFLNTNSGAAGNDQPLDINTDDTSEWSTYQKLMRGLFLLVALVPERMIR